MEHNNNNISQPGPRAERGYARILDREAPLQWAEMFVCDRYTDTTAGPAPSIRLLHHWRGEFWHYDGAHYTVKDQKTLRAEMYKWLDKSVYKLSADKDATEPFKPNKHHVDVFRDALESYVHRRPTEDAPAWLHKLEADPPLNEILVCKNGLLHIPTLKLLPPTPRLFTIASLEVEFDSNAPEPKRWLRFLEEIWSDDPDSIFMLQLFIAYIVSGDTNRQKIGMFVGPKRSGKGTIARLLKEILGSDLLCNPTFRSLGDRFGMENLVGRSLAIIGDARMSGKADVQTVVERLLSISGEDDQSVQRKNRTDWNGRLKVRFLILSNELPKLDDVAGVIASRFVIFRFTQSFYGHEDTALDSTLKSELSGILNWTLEAFDTMRAVGVIQPQSSVEDIRQLEEIASPMQTFVNERIVQNNETHVWVDDLFDLWETWCHERNIPPGDITNFGKNLRTVIPSITHKQRRRDGRQTGAYVGIEMLSDKILS